MAAGPEACDPTLDPDEFVRAVSNDRVIGVAASGPVFSRHTAVRRTPKSTTFVPAVSARTRLLVKALTACWIVTYLAFWVWWFRPEHRTNPATFAINSLLLLNISTLPGYYLIAVNRLRRVSPALRIPSLRVAMVVTKAPSEPWPVVRRTLQGMLQQRFPYPYDVWLCDEDPSQETLTWCDANHVAVSTRHGVEAYQRQCWPRRQRCKEGNLAYFYDHYGYRDYDVVSQLDCDHVPDPSYLAEMVRPFADPAIGYVAAPSINDKNRTVSWTVRGRLFQEAPFHGPHQLGHNGDLAPVCIGSHYAVRTQALARIGGVGPELAEDFSTSYLMYIAGFSGVFAIDAQAHGDGPTDFPAMVTQEFQWARSLFLIMLNLLPRTIGRLPATFRLRFGYVLAYYPLLAMTTVGGLGLVSAAAILGIQWVNVNYLEFLGFFFMLGFWVLLLRLLLRKQGLLRPNNAPLISWEATLFILARWPYVAWGLYGALKQRFSGRPAHFAVTPKGTESVAPLPLRVMLPYLVIVVTLSSAALVGMTHPGAAGYTGLCLLAATSYAVLCVTVPVLHGLHASGQATDRAGAFLRAVQRSLPVCLLALAPLAAALYGYPGYFAAEFLR